MNKYATYLIAVLSQIADIETPIIGAEIGVWKGETSEVLLRAFPNLFLYMVDPWEKVPMMETMHKNEGELLEAYNEAMQSTWFAATRRMVLHDVGNRCCDYVGLLDFVFIDANHMYDSVREDISVWSGKVRLGGIISGHDYGGRVHDREGWGVKRAVDEYAQEHGYTVRTTRETIWWLRKE